MIAGNLLTAGGGRATLVTVENDDDDDDDDRTEVSQRMDGLIGWDAVLFP